MPLARVRQRLRLTASATFALGLSACGDSAPSPVEPPSTSRPRARPPRRHDVVATPRNTVIFLAQDARPVGGDTVVAGEAVWEWDPDAGTDPVKLWSAWDDLSWEADQAWNSTPTDWLHANALWIGPSGNVLVSLAWLDQIVSIAPDFGSLEWRLGVAPDGSVVWHLEVTGEGMLDPFALYRATPVSALVGETLVSGGG